MGIVINPSTERRAVMKNNIFELVGSLPTLLQNTHLNVNLQGWPAAVAVIAVSFSGVTAYAIKVFAPNAEDSADTQRPHMAA